MVIQILLVLLTALAASTLADLVPLGSSVTVNDVYYFISPIPQGQAYDAGSFRKHSSSAGFVPVTVVAEAISASSLQSLFTNWTSQDDVWQSGFLEFILLSSFNASDDCLEQSYFGNNLSTILPLQTADMPSGPYFLQTSTGQVHQAYRLYEDFAGAFLQSVLQQPDGSFQTLSAQVPASAAMTIGVPSRLYFRASKAKPLAGVRIGVKDIYALAGVKRSNGNRAWYGLYPPAKVTGSAIQNLIDAGAIIVGLQKPSQFANGETATDDWVDYHAPFNPRGDGYQDASSSSAGGGASIASYEWLDLAVGSDTGGSIRGPAGVQGIFGNRPTHGLVRLDHVMPLSPKMDTAGFLARDPALWDAACAAMYLENYTSLADQTPEYPKTVYLLDSGKNDSATQMRRDFASKLASFLNTSVTWLDLEGEWAASGPAQVKAQNLSQVLNLTYTALITKQQTRLVRDPFYADYAVAHDGRRPFVDPVPLTRWAWADTQPDSVLDDAIANKTLFMDWFNKEILPPVQNPQTCSSAFLLHMDDTASFISRNQYLDSPGLPLGFADGSIAIFSETPDSVFPVGQVPFSSSITNHTEYLPVTIDVVAAKGCDGLIAKLANDLVASGLLTVPKTGAALDGGTILFRRDNRY